MRISLAVLLLFATTAPLRAQMGVPFQVVPRQSAPPAAIYHLVITAEVTAINHNVFADDFEPYPNVVRVFFAGERLRLHAGVGQINASTAVRDGFTFGLGGGYAVRRVQRIWQGGIDLLAGVTYSHFDHVGAPDFEQIDLPFGLGFSMVLPLPKGLNASPWAAFRGQVRISDRLSPVDDSKDTLVGLGSSGGLLIEFVKGDTGPALGLNVGVDWLIMPDDQFPPGSDHEVVFAFGISARFTWLP